MTEQHHYPLETMLQNRAFEPASPDLAERIIASSVSVPRQTSVSVTYWLSRLFEEFHLPSPSYALGGALAIGLIIGVVLAPQLSLTNAATDGEQTELTDFLYMEDMTL